jgi:hypothetical protein
MSFETYWLIAAPAALFALSVVEWAAIRITRNAFQPLSRSCYIV